MNKVFKNDEPPEMCFLNRKVKFSVLNVLPKPLFTFKTFFSNIRKFNTYFQITSLSVTNIITDNPESYEPSEKMYKKCNHCETLK